jgi:uncharacterized membrane protein YoaT (DUF817 family)
VTNYRNKNKSKKTVKILDNTFFSKSILGFQFWTFINVHFQEIQNIFRKSGFFSLFDHNALNFILNMKNFVTIIFYIFLKKNLGTFFCQYIYVDKC